MTPVPRLIGMIHLGPLPGSPRWQGDLEAILTRAVLDAVVLAGSGFDAILVENFGDAPFFADDVPDVTVAAMTRAVAEVKAAVGVPVGVNVLRNDALAAMAVAAATGAAFIRVNVLTGTMTTDQGTITGRSADLLRLRASLGCEVAVLADVFVKHAVPPPGLTIEQAAVDTVERGMADGLIVTGPGTGQAPPATLVERVAMAVPGTPVLVGSGVTARTVARLVTTAHGVIAGTSLKVAGVTTNPVDGDRAAAFIRAARSTRQRGKAPGPRSARP